LKRDKKKKIIERYNNSSQFYDKRYNLIQREKFEFFLSQFDYFEKYILDAGCGTGLIYEFISLSEKKVRNRFISIDISINMLKKLKNKQKILKNKLSISPILSDIENIPIRNNIIDGIISFTSFQNLGDVKKGFLELVRVSKLGTEINLSILKKDKRIDSFVAFIKPFFYDFYKSTNENLEDAFIKGKLSK
jgi:ubiquinone/menaquinone biosynthesis C-methylase UbiE